MSRKKKKKKKSTSASVISHNADDITTSLSRFLCCLPLLFLSLSRFSSPFSSVVFCLFSLKKQNTRRLLKYRSILVHNKCLIVNRTMNQLVCRSSRVIERPIDESLSCSSQRLHRFDCVCRKRAETTSSLSEWIRAHH